MYRASLMTGLAALAVAAVAGSANAGVQFFSYGAGAPGMSLITNFAADPSQTNPPQGPIPADLPSALYGWSGGGVVLNTTSGIGADPATSSAGQGTANYLSILAGQSETLTIPGSAGFKDVELYVGSLDGYNGLSFTLSGVANPVTYSGTALGMVSGAANGNQTAANTNGVFLFQFDAPVTSITFASGSNSFEIASISAAVPEPSTWAMMLIGVLAVGVALRGARRAALATA